MHKKAWLGILALGAIGLLNGRKQQEDTPKPAPLVQIGITKIATHSGIDAIRDCFLEDEELGLGRGRKRDVRPDRRTGDHADRQEHRTRDVGDKCDLILAISRPSSQTVAQKTKGTAIPLVFGAA